MNYNNVLITGVSGFVGSYLTKYLLDNEANVYIIEEDLTKDQLFMTNMQGIFQV